MSVSRQIGWSQESNLLYQILKQITKLTSIVFGLKPKYKVFTGLVTQIDGPTEDSINSGDLTIGVTYAINEESVGMDFTNVGAPNNNIGTYFIATGTTPNSWGEGAAFTLAFNAGAPTVIILENTIGNIWFTWEESFRYNINSNELFTLNKTISNIEEPNSYYRPYDSTPSFLKIYTLNNTISAINLINVLVDSSNNTSAEIDSVLSNFLLEIRVYN
jgi:hypothetical protein